MSLQPRDAAKLEVQTVYLTNLVGFLWFNDQPSVLERISERYDPAHPHTLALGGGDLVPDPLSSDLPLKLGEGEQDVQSQATHRRSGIELLGHGNETNPAPIELLHDFGEIGQGSCEPIYLIYDH